MRIRYARVADSHLLLNFRNELGMREASFNSSFIDFNSHHAWLERTLKRKDCWLFIAELNDCIPVGYVRFNEVGGNAEISVTIDHNLRGQGLGRQVITEAIKVFKNLRGDLTPVAIIKNSNNASIHSFRAAGFETVGLKLIAGIQSIEMRFINPNI